jgi:hypothetical protein
VADAALTMLDVDHLGFDLMDRKLLARGQKFGGGPVGLDNLAAAIGESSDTIEDVLEPYLIQQGYLQRTPRGRMATASIWQHFGADAAGGGGRRPVVRRGAGPPLATAPPWCDNPGLRIFSASARPAALCPCISPFRISPPSACSSVVT